LSRLLSVFVSHLPATVQNLAAVAVDLALIPYRVKSGMIASTARRKSEEIGLLVSPETLRLIAEMVMILDRFAHAVMRSLFPALYPINISSERII
jgi:hypothetical protein